MAGFIAAVVVVYREPVIGPAFVPFQTAIAQVTLTVLHLLGVEGTRFGLILYHPGGFGYQISLGCTGFLPAAFLAVGIVAYPATARCRALGILVGVPGLLLLNLGRLVHLFVIGVGRPAWFDLAHEVIWQSVIALSVLLAWVGWAMWADRVRARGGGPAAGVTGTLREAVGTSGR